MTIKKQKLELTWIGKDEQPKLEPRILIEDPDKSYGEKDSENMLIFGDNLLALKALEQEFAGKIKCVCVDPPYNTGNAFEHYEDGVEHSLWLNLMKSRIELLKNLLRDDGSIWINIDDDESHYLKVMCDEIFGRNNFVTNIVWQKKYGASNDSKWFSDTHDHILVYAKNKNNWRPNLLTRPKELDAKYSNPDNDIRGLWISTNLSVKTFTEKNYYPIVSPKGNEFYPPPTRCWVVSEEKYLELFNDNRIWFGKKGDSRPYKKTFLSEVQQGIVPISWWPHSDSGHNIEAKGELRKLFGDHMDLFATPKPERLLQRIVHIASNENDTVLDSFLGSGTTAAVAQKMNRKWIGIELGEHCHTHCIPRLQKVINGEDEGGISESVNWKGGGGFKYYYLAPSLLNQDEHGNWIISKEYNAQMLAAALAKNNGFRFEPDESVYWKQGQSTEKDFIFTTTNFLTIEHIDKIHDQMGEDESLLICCKSYSKGADDKYSNISVKKIPNLLLGSCEFGKEDYSLNIVSMPIDEDEPDFEPKGVKEEKPKSKKKNKNVNQEENLFD